MTVALVSKDLEGTGLWRITWTSDAQPVRIYRDGRLVDTTRANTRLFQIPAGEYATIELLDADDTASAVGASRRIIMQWDREEGADHYRVEQYVDAAWVLRRTFQQTDQAQYTWRSHVLEDSTEHTFRVVPIGENQNEGDVALAVVTMVREPDSPNIAHGYDSGTGVVTITEAA